jgi:hypothetical protein
MLCIFRRRLIIQMADITVTAGVEGTVIERRTRAGQTLAVFTSGGDSQGKRNEWPC